MTYDIIVVGAGPAGLTAAIFAARRGLSVKLIDCADAIGGALLINRGQLSGAGTRLQAERGIEDSPDAHYADAMRISKGTSDAPFLAMAVQLQGPFIDWLMDEGFEMEADMPRILHGHEAYDRARTYWGREEGLSILKVLARLLDEQIAQGRVDLSLETDVDGLIVGDDGVAGVTAGGQDFHGRAVILATGGYGANPELFARLHEGATLWPGSYRHATGRGIELGLQAGGTLVHVEKFLPNFGGVLDHTLDPPRYRSPGGLVPQDRMPWEIIVNLDGERFLAEDNDSADERSAVMMAQPRSCGFVIYDQPIRDQAPSIFSYFPPDKAERFYDPEGSIVSADSLDDLAARCGIDGAALKATVEDYNRAVDSGRDRLGRRHMPRRIETAPFYALPIASYTVRGFAGLRVDTGFRVLDADGATIGGLHAIGEVLGSHLSGKGGVGGMALSPALAFGRLLGETIHG